MPTNTAGAIIAEVSFADPSLGSSTPLGSGTLVISSEILSVNSDVLEDENNFINLTGILTGSSLADLTPATITISSSNFITAGTVIPIVAAPVTAQITQSSALVIGDTFIFPDEAPLILTVEAVNTPPVAQDDYVIGNFISSVSGNVLVDNGNGADSDANGDFLTVEPIEIYPFDTAEPRFGIDANGDFLYVSSIAFIGTDSFEYTVLDGKGGSDTGTVHITILPPEGSTLGDDTANNLIGNIEDDLLFGFEGNDFILGGSGRDFINGGDGNDHIRGDRGSDDINGGAGDDIINGNRGDDFLFGGDGNDTVAGSEGNDVVLGGNGDDIVKGEDGHDWVQGNAGNDIVRGHQGHDTLFGNEGDDQLEGYDGGDFLIGGPGADILYGMDDNDIFVFEITSFDGTVDTLKDFSLEEFDSIRLEFVLEDFDEFSDAISDFVSFTNNRRHSEMHIDRDGSGNAFDFEHIATIENINDLDSQTLFDNNHLTVLVPDPFGDDFIF